MEALILSCGTGGGHDSAAKAVAEELTRRGSSATVLNLFTLENERTAELVNELYIQVVQAAPKLFGAAYKAGEAYRNLQVHSPVYWANGKFADALRGYLDEHHFDVIIATHMYPAQTLTNLKRQGVSIPPTVLVATDYTCIPFMEETDCDYCVIPSPELTGEFCSRGFPVERLLPYGIPVREAFSVNGTKSEARRRLGLEQDSQYILLAGGSMGAGSIVDAVKAVEGIIQMRPDCRLLVLCGTNRRLFSTLERQCAGREQIELIGFTDKMPDYMRACDLFITKPGGLSSTEAAVCGVPLIHISPIPGCETRNAQFFSSRGMSILATEPKRDLGSALEKMSASCLPEQMVMAQKCFVSDNAAAKLCDCLEQICQ